MTQPLESVMRGSRYVAEKALSPLLLSEEEFDSLLQNLLNDRENVNSNETRNEALFYIHNLALTAASFGSDPVELNIKEGFYSIRLPSTESKLLVERDIVTEEKHVTEIEARDAERRERKDKISENSIVIQALEPAQKAQLPELLKKQLKISEPVLLLKEHYTRAIPKSQPDETKQRQSSLEFNVVGNYVIGCISSETFEEIPQLYFLEETITDSHVHVFVEEPFYTWIKVDERACPELYPLPEEIYPKPQKVREDFLATNEQIATLLVLLVSSVPLERPGLSSQNSFTQLSQ